ncbi:MAG: 30S ribosomal protein S6 [Candidatus Zambryskibacteria bacterium]|nr:30S ribosomal protein S6 [Candidatus Zambryskibacteria bacterium]
MEKENATPLKIASKTDTSKIYELGYILVSSLPDEKIVDEVSVLKDLLSANGGDIISSEDPILIDLAYPMLKVVSAQRQKYSRGYFGWVKFEGEPDSLTAIKKVLDLSHTMLRYMIVKTVRENTLLNGKMVLRQEEREEVALEDAGEEAPIESGEVLDKTIDDLVIA